MRFRSRLCTLGLVWFVGLLAPPLAAQPAAAEEPVPHDISEGSSPDDRQVRIVVTDEAGTPVPRARLWVNLDHPNFGNADPNVPDRRAILYTKADGAASVWFPPQPAGIVASAKGFAPQVVRNAELQKRDPFMIKLTKGQPIRGRVVRVGGASAGLGVADAQVEAYVTEKPAREFGDFTLRGRTAADGTFELPHAAPGPYTLTTHVPDERSPAYVESAKLIVGADAPPPPLELSAKPGAALAGTVISAHPDVVVSEMWVRAYTDKPHHSHRDAQCKPDGSFVLTALPPDAAGHAHVRCPPGYVPAFDALTEHGSFRQDGHVLDFSGLPAGRHEGLVVRVLKAVTITGVVRDADSKPVPGLRGVIQPGGRLFRVEPDGRYTASVMPDTDVTLEFVTKLRTPPLATVSVRGAEGERVETDVALPR